MIVFPNQEMSEVSPIIDLTTDDDWITVRKTPRDNFPIIIGCKGLDIGDGKYRLIFSKPQFLSYKIRKLHDRGRVITSFSKYELIKLAWKIGVINPYGIRHHEMIGDEYCDEQDYFRCFAVGWKHCTKYDMSIYIWSHLQNTDNIIIR